MVKKHSTIYLCFILALSCPVKGQDSDAVQRIETLLSQNSDYEFADPMAWQSEILERMQSVYANEEQRQSVEDSMLRFFESDATYAAKKMIWVEFSNVVTERSVPRLIDLLDGSEDSTLVLLTLIRANLGDGEVIVEYWSKLNDSSKLGVLNHLNGSLDDNVVKLLMRSLKSTNSEIADAAFFALARTGSSATGKILLKRLDSKKTSTDLEKLDALLVGAQQLSNNGHVELATALYEKLTKSEFPTTIRAAALLGLFHMSDSPSEFIRNRLAKEDESLRPSIIHMARDLPSDFTGGIELLESPNLNNTDKAQMMLLFAGRGDPTLHDYVLQHLTSKDGNLKEAAFKALPSVVKANDVEPLLTQVVDFEKNESERIATALSTIPGEEVDKVLIARIQEATEDQLAILLDVVRQRGLSSTTDLLFNFTESENKSIRRDAFKTLEAVATPEQIPQALKQLLHSENSPTRKAWERTVFRLAKKNPNESNRSNLLVETLKQDISSANTASLLLVVGEIASPTDVEILKTYLNNSDKQLQLIAINALAKWPNSAPFNDLIEMFRISEDSEVRESSLKGTLNLLVSDRSVDESKKLEQINQLSTETLSSSEEKTVISALGEVQTIDTLKRLVSLLENSQHKPEIERSIRMVTRFAYRQDPDAARKAILRVREMTEDSDFREWIDDGLRKEIFPRS